jgi:hypothetical protein
MTSTHTMECAHCDHELAEHFDADGRELCQGCVRELLAGDHPYSDYLPESGSDEERLVEARRWACVDFDH